MWRRSWPVILIAGLVCLFFWDTLFAGKIPCMRDTVFDVMSWRQFAADALVHGHFPLWNPYSSCGQPFMANPQSAVLYPPNLLFCVLPATLALKAVFLLHFLLAGVSCYLLARHWRLSVAAALICAISFTFSSLIVSAMEFTAHFETLAWCPLLLLCISEFMDSWLPPGWQAFGPGGPHSRFSRFIALSLVMAMQYLAGYPQTFLYGLVIAFAFVVARAGASLSFRLLLISTTGLAVAGLVALCLCMPQFLLTSELIPLSERAGKIDPFLDMASASARHLLTFVLPFVFGRPGYPDKYWAHTIFEFWAGTCYVGVVPLILASFSPLLAWPNRTPGAVASHRILLVFSVGLVIFGLLMAAGEYTPLYTLVCGHLPIFDRMRWPSKFYQLALMGLSILAALGWQAALAPSRRENGVRRRRPEILIALAWAALLAAMVGAYPCARASGAFFAWLTGHAEPFTAEQHAVMLKDYQAAIVWLALSLAGVLAALFRWLKPVPAAFAIVVVAYLNVFSVGRQIHFIADDDIYEYVSPSLLSLASKAGTDRVHTQYWNTQFFYGTHDRELFLWAKDTTAAETFPTVGLYKVWGGCELPLTRYVRFYQLQPSLALEQRERLADLLCIRYLTYGEDLFKILGGEAPRTAQTLERASALPRALLVGRWRAMHDFDEAVAGVLDPSFDPFLEAVIEEGEESGGEGDSPGKPGEVTGIRYGWNRVEIEATATRRCLLLLNDAWYPGWKAVVDGQSAPILRANVVFRGIFVGPGPHKVLFVYDPWLFKLGWAVSALTVLVMVALCLVSRHLSRRSRPEAPRVPNGP